eukprot:948802-Prymnesium_polylepis.1
MGAVCRRWGRRLRWRCAAHALPIEHEHRRSGAVALSPGARHVFRGPFGGVCRLDAPRVARKPAGGVTRWDLDTPKCACGPYEPGRSAAPHAAPFTLRVAYHVSLSLYVSLTTCPYHSTCHLPRACRACRACRGCACVSQVEEDGVISWKPAEVRSVTARQRTFIVCINGDEGFIEEFSLRDENAEWRYPLGGGGGAA